MARTIGIDPGTVSFDVCGLDDGQVFLDTTIPSPELARDPQVLVDLVRSAAPVDLIVAPSGYGLPLTSIADFGDAERFLFTLVDERERGGISVLGGMGRMISLMKDSGLPFIFLPGVIHLPTIPEHRKANKVDMGTTDKLCCLVLGIFDQARHYGVPYDETSFVYAEVGGAYTAVMAVEHGQVVDGLGGTTGGPGFLSLGSMDGELAYLLGAFHKNVLFTGGAAYIAGDPTLTPEEFAARAAHDPAAHMAFEALLEGVVKSVAAELTIVSRPREILISGRLCRTPAIREALVRRLSPLGPVRRVAGLAEVAKEAAQGAALVADGLAGGRFADLVENLQIRGSSGTALDHLYIQGAAELRARYLG